MPTYEYECNACGHAFEHFQMMSDEPLKKCPKCKKPKLQRLIGAGAGIIFKGSGFYETDYKRKGDGAPKSSAKAEPKPAEGGAKTEAKSTPSPAKGKGEKS